MGNRLLLRLLRVYLPLAALVLSLIPCLANAEETEEPVSVLLAGDIMATGKIKQSGLRNGLPEQSLFGALFELIKPLVEKADIAFANLETPISKSEPVRPVPFVFNAPMTLIGGLKWTGFDILSVANNHMLDQKLIGLKETLTAIQKQNITAVGAGLNRESALRGHVTEVRGLRIGFLAFTALINGGNTTALKSKSPYLNLTERKKDLHEAIASIRKRSDVVLLSLHWGNEYEARPRPWQEAFAKDLHERGVDVIVGHHPHVLQPIKWYRSKAGINRLTIFSLGNLISSQSAWYVHGKAKVNDGRPRDGALVELSLSRSGVEGFRVHPIWTDNWIGPEAGVRTIRISEEIRRIDGEISNLRPSPEKTFLLERRRLLADRHGAIYRSLQLRIPSIERPTRAPAASKPR